MFVNFKSYIHLLEKRKTELHYQKNTDKLIKSKQEDKYSLYELIQQNLSFDSKDIKKLIFSILNKQSIKENIQRITDVIGKKHEVVLKKMIISFKLINKDFFSNIRNYIQKEGGEEQALLLDETLFGFFTDLPQDKQRLIFILFSKLNEELLLIINNFFKKLAYPRGLTVKSYLLARFLLDKWAKGDKMLFEDPSVFGLLKKLTVSKNNLPKLIFRGLRLEDINNLFSYFHNWRPENKVPVLDRASSWSYNLETAIDFSGIDNNLINNQNLNDINVVLIAQPQYKDVVIDLSNFRESKYYGEQEYVLKGDYDDYEILFLLNFENKTYYLNENYSQYHETFTDLLQLIDPENIFKPLSSKARTSNKISDKKQKHISIDRLMQHQKMLKNNIRKNILYDLTNIRYFINTITPSERLYLKQLINKNIKEFNQEIGEDYDPSYLYEEYENFFINPEKAPELLIPWIYIIKTITITEQYMIFGNTLNIINSHSISTNFYLDVNQQVYLGKKGEGTNLILTLSTISINKIIINIDASQVKINNSTKSQIETSSFDDFKAKLRKESNNFLNIGQIKINS